MSLSFILFFPLLDVYGVADNNVDSSNNVIFISSMVRVATLHDTCILRKRTPIIPRIPIYNLASKQSHMLI